MNPKQEERKCSSECAAPLCTPSGDVSAASGKTNCDDSPLRRLRRENHLLRLQLLKLREQQHSLLHQVAAGGLLSSNGATPTTEIVYGTMEPPHIAATLGVDAGPACSRADLAEESTNDEAAALRARTLLRQEARQQRITPARAILASAGQAGLAAGPAPPNQQPPLEPSNETEALQRETVPPTARTGRGQSPPPAKDRTPSETVPPVPTDAEGDMSAQAMRQRFQSRKAQRRLRLEQMLGPSCEDAPRCLSSLPEDGPLSHATSSNNSDAMLGTGTLLSNAAALEGTSDASGGGGAAAVSHCAARTSETTSGATAAPAGPTQNPNQIGRAVTDAVKNNSWYLCKVLEAALLDTIQARRVLQDSPPSRTSAPVSLVSQPAPAQSGKTGEAAERGSSGAATPKAMQSLPSAATTTPTTTAAPPFLYQLGVSDTALRRAIEESLVLAFRCIHDAPQRLTSQQAAEEAVPPFEAENKDDELRRCFAGHAGRHSAERNGGASENSTEDENGGGPSTAEADDDTLDPFARLLLARISAELPSKSAKVDKKHKEHHGGSSSGSVDGGADGGQLLSATCSKGVLLSSPSTAKPSTAFVMAAAGGDSKMHIPKKHFSRLDEVQVEMHAPVIFNQIRGFLRLDIDRFRRSFLQYGVRGEIADGACDGARADGTPLRLTLQQQQQRRLRAGVENATAWRISVSPGKSGTTLLYFGDYVMKTVRPSEIEFFTRKFLPAYVRYCERNPHTLLPRFYALITVRWWKAGMAQHFVLMHNVFATPYYIHRIYDVKGSTVNRTALQPGKPPPRTAFGALLLKDNDLPPQLIICGAYQRAILLAQFRSDVGFLRQLSVVDYSCMIGVRSRLFSREEGPSKTIVLQRYQHHDCDKPYVDPLGGGELPTPLTDHQRTRSKITNVTSAAADAGAKTVTVALTGAGGQPASLPDAHPAFEDDVYVCIHGCDGGLLSLPIYAPGDDTTAREDVYYLGIIDVLQTYNSAKKLESFAKGFVNDRQAISVIPPEGYSERLYKVLERITV
ncbi:phosphatidylinositol-4-phosphate 5-kinase-like [Lotmaria passim]